uniref:Uncharacterized protein n=1 Tax=Prevotella sp. GTC17260 TaxID=3236796 RepID=A0AB33JAU6_9BACT
MVNVKDNLLYRLRRKGVRVNTKERTFFISYGEDFNTIVQISRLRYEYHFNVQFEII